MTTPKNSPPLPPSLLAREQEAQVATDEANARKAAADADTSALSLAQTKYKSLVPDLTGVATNAVDDKSTGVAFSGLVTYSALNHAAEIIANRVSDVLGDTAGGRLLLSDEIERGAGAGSCRRSELTRGLATLPSSRPPRRRAGLGGFHLGRQVPGAGQQLAGDRDGGDLLPAASGDGRVAGGEVRGSPGRLRGLVERPPQPH